MNAAHDRRILALAALASAVLHVLLVAGVRVSEGVHEAADRAPPIEARLVPPPRLEPPAPDAASRAITPRQATEAPRSAETRRPVREEEPPAPGLPAEAIARVELAPSAHPSLPDIAEGTADAPEPPGGEDVDGSTARGDEMPLQDADEAARERLFADGADAFDPGPPADYPVAYMRLAYDLYYGEVGVHAGRLAHTWTTDGARYVAHTEAEATGLLGIVYNGRFIQRSVGRIGPEGLYPTEYFVQRGAAERYETARFDWNTGTVTLAWKGERKVLDLPPGTQDPLSMLHQIYFLAPLPRAAQFKVATSRKLGGYAFEIVGRETVETPLGTVDAVHLRRVDDDRSRTELWLDPGRHFLPVRVVAVDRAGNVFEQRVREMEAEPVRPAKSTRGPADQPSLSHLAASSAK